MRMTSRNICAVSLLACAVTFPAAASPIDHNRLYSKSELVVEPRFSDEIIGTGPDVILIPGLASSRAVYKATADRLKAHYRVHLIQVAGFAGEPARANAKGSVLLPTAEALDAYLKAKNLAPATVVGASAGGAMALTMSETHPEDLKKVMLVDTLPYLGVLFKGPQATVESVKPLADKMRKPAPHLTKVQLAARLSPLATSAANRHLIATWGRASNPTTMANGYADNMMLDMRPGLEKLTTPVTIAVPDYAARGSAPGKNMATYAEYYSSAKTVTLVEITHSLHFAMLDQPKQFAAALDKFLSQP